MMLEAQSGNPGAPEPTEAPPRKPRHWEIHAERLRLTPVPLTLSDEALEEINKKREEFPQKKLCGYECKSTVPLENGPFGWAFSGNNYTFEGVPQYYCEADDITTHPEPVVDAMRAAISDYLTSQIAEPFPAKPHAAAFNQEYRTKYNPQE